MSEPVPTESRAAFKGLRSENKFDSKWWPLITNAGFIAQGRSDRTFAAEDIKALRLREASLKISDYCTAVTGGKVKDLDHEAQLMKGFVEGYQTLEQEGVTARMHGIPDDDPRATTVGETTLLSDAEYIGGQWLDLKAQGIMIVPLTTLMGQAQEMSESTENIGGVPSNVIKRDAVTPEIRDWAQVTTILHVTNHQLAPGLPRPDLTRYNQPPLNPPDT